MLGMAVSAEKWLATVGSGVDLELW